MECGLGNPPDIFTTNASESINAILKHKVNYKRNELPVFISKVKETIQEQQREVERALIGRGKYELREQYKHLQIAEHKWFSMSSDQRKNHLSRVQCLTVCNSTSPIPSLTPSASDWVRVRVRALGFTLVLLPFSLPGIIQTSSWYKICLLVSFKKGSCLLQLPSVMRVTTLVLRVTTLVLRVATLVLRVATFVLRVGT